MVVQAISCSAIIRISCANSNKALKTTFGATKLHKSRQNEQVQFVRRGRAQQVLKAFFSALVCTRYVCTLSRSCSCNSKVISGLAQTCLSLTETTGGLSLWWVA